MSYFDMKNRGVTSGRWMSALAALACCAGTAMAATPGISANSATGSSSTFNLVANQGYSSQPDGMQIYSWGYGCVAGSSPTFKPAVFNSGIGNCPTMQLPGPTLIVAEGTTVTITLTNGLPTGVGNTSIVFPGIPTTSTGGTAGLLAQEAVPGGSVTYTLNTTGKAGTHAYYSGTQPDLQIEMGMYGALVVVPTGLAPGCVAVGTTTSNRLGGGAEFRLAASAYDHSATCYDREYLFQFAEIDPAIHAQAEAQVKAIAACPAGQTNKITGQPCPPAKLAVVTEPWHPRYFLINGRSMPDDMDANYAPNYPAQPYNGNPHMHPLDQVLLRTIGQGRWEHPFHEHANHVRILARDGNLLLSQTDQTKLAGLMMFTTDTFPGQSFDGIFYWSGKGLNWDIYGHTPKTVNGVVVPACPGPGGAASGPGVPAKCDPGCVPDANGFFTSSAGAVAPQFSVAGALTNPGLASFNYGEWCADHNHPLEANPAGSVGAGGPATLPDPLVATNGLWYNGTPYLGPDAVNRSRGPTPLPQGGALQNPPGESGIAFMWHSHNEREITTDDVFPGGMLMMMLVDPPVWYIDETL
jgi:FtsP/CotA-like multicopper oxidase with cupredoxin domain